MFNWCQSVKIYNIENHYHFYSDEQQIIQDHTNNIPLNKLKPGSISVLSNTNTKYSSKSCSKRGLVLVKQLNNKNQINDYKNIIKNRYINNKYNIHRQSTFSDVPILSKISRINIEQINDNDIDKIQKNSQKQSIISIKTQNKHTQKGIQMLEIQKIGSKNKPLINQKQKQQSRLKINKILTDDIKIDKNKYKSEIKQQILTKNDYKILGCQSEINRNINKVKINYQNHIQNPILHPQASQTSYSIHNGQNLSSGSVQALQLPSSPSLAPSLNSPSPSLIPSTPNPNPTPTPSSILHLNIPNPLSKLDIHQLTTSRHYNSKQTSQISQSYIPSHISHISNSSHVSHVSQSYSPSSNIAGSCSNNSNRSKYNVRGSGNNNNSLYSNSLVSEQYGINVNNNPHKYQTYTNSNKDQDFDLQLQQQQRQQSHSQNPHTRNSYINNNQYMYLRIMQQSRGQARQASIILSNILSRSNNHITNNNTNTNNMGSMGNSNYDSGYRPCLSLASHIRRTNTFNTQHNNNNNNTNTQQQNRIKKLNQLQDYDRNTIISNYNDNTDPTQPHNNQHPSNLQLQQSIRIQQSQIYQTNPKNNFIYLPQKHLTTSSYTLSLVIQINIQYLISIKQIGFHQMGHISQQLQIYQFIQQKLYNNQSYHNILQLYQIQITGGLYMFIKEPYTYCMVEYIGDIINNNNKKDNNMDMGNTQYEYEQINKLLNSLKQLIKILIYQFQYFQIYPIRLLKLQDFVICYDIIKLHNLSIFKQNKNRIIQVEDIMEEFKYQNVVGYVRDRCGKDREKRDKDMKDRDGASNNNNTLILDNLNPNTTTNNVCHSSNTYSNSHSSNNNQDRDRDRDRDRKQIVFNSTYNYTYPPTSNNNCTTSTPTTPSTPNYIYKQYEQIKL